MQGTLFDKLSRTALFSDKLPLETRSANLVCIMGIIGAVIALVIKAAQGIPHEAVLFISGTLVVSALLYVLFTKFGHNNAGIVALLVGVTDIPIPYTFFYGGGLSSALVIYFCLAIVLQFLLFSGVQCLVMCGINIAVTVSSLLYAGVHPEAIQFHITDPRILSYDIMQGMLICGIFIGGIFRFQLWVYRHEREKAEEASRVKGQFLANMSHEIRTPLSAIIGMTAIAEQTDDPERKAYSLQQVRNASRHLLGVVNDILDMSKIEEDKLELGSVPFGVAEVIERTAILFGFRTKEKNQQIDIDIAPDVPARLIGDDQRLAQVMGNLLSNAIKFTPEGGRIEISAGLESETDEACTLRVSIKDNGIGITPEQQSRLFIAFQQADADTTRKYGGTGLGLTISRRIVEMMGGRIWVESEYGKGSTFSFTVHLVRVPEAAAPAQPEAKAEADITLRPEDYDFSAYRMLIVEDVDINREIIEGLLEPTGIQTEHAENGEAAVALVEADPARYDVVLMDIQMPIMDGYEATRRIRALPSAHAKALPIVAVSANIFQEDIDKSIEAGMNAHIGKPIDIAEVIALLDRYLKLKA
ncbi:MAG: response regulator [Clostridiales Family XIII bacterium]|jgi:signal transduction histidine kinase/CheY-like chemotaxis protein|nr:response regulator [Clostridiales Family XIII bacterium]